MTRDITRADMVLAQRIARHASPGDCDIESAAMAGLLTASQRWKGEGSWRAFAAKAIRWAIWDELRKPHAEPVDMSTLPDVTVVVGVIVIDDDAKALHARLHVELEAMRCEFLLDGVDRRRVADRGAIAHLQRVLS